MECGEAKVVCVGSQRESRSQKDSGRCGGEEPFWMGRNSGEGCVLSPWGEDVVVVAVEKEPEKGWAETELAVLRD